MKSFTLSIICTILAIAALAQAPQGISHQAVVRNAAGNLVINSIIGVRITVLRDSIDGAPVYSETQYPVSNSSGLITFVVGHGMPDENTLFNNINWLLGSHFLKLEIDPDGGVNYRISGTSQLQGVPYAFVADDVVFINPEGSEHGNVLIYNSATGMYEPDSAGAVVFSKPLDIMPRAAMRGQQLSVSFSGGTQIAFSEDTNSCPGVYADVVLHFSQGTSTLNIHPRGSYFLSPGRFDAIFDIPATAPAGLYDIIFGHSSPCEFTAFESFRIRGKILLSTSAVTNITSNSAQSGGNITDDGGAPITARGVCWSTAPNPTIASNKTNNGSGTGSFTSNLTVLNPGTTYYVRAYATSDYHTSYGQELVFVTEPGQNGYVSGLVLDAATLNGLANVNIQVFSGQNLIANEASNPDGGFLFLLPAGENYTINFSKTGYIQATYYNIAVINNSTTYLQTVLQIDNSHSGVGNFGGSVLNALNGNPVSGADLLLRLGMNNQTGVVITSTQSLSNGTYQFSNLEAGNYTIEAVHADFITAFNIVTCIGGQTTLNQDIALTPLLSDDEIRIVLVWGPTPPDLDSHLTGPIPDSQNRFHVYWANKNFYFGGELYANLDLDDVSSYGPETVTIYQQTPGMYRYSVHDYTNRNSTNSTALSNSSAIVRVYKGDIQTHIFHVPSNTGGTLWTVFELEGNILTPVNTMSYEANPGMITSGNDALLIMDIPAKSTK